MLGTLLAILGLGFLIFIHELGHYWMARRVGMKIEVFSIGFGSPLISWKRDNGEKWQIGWLPFGGYVKIRGTEREPGQDPYTVSDGFFGKGPWARIKVAFMGPFVNILFALFVFISLYMMGGRDQFFSSLTPTVGAVDPASALYNDGFRPGDEILAYNNQPVKGFKNHILAPLMADGKTNLKVRLHNWSNDSTEEKTLSLVPYKKERPDGEKMETFGVLAPASFVTFNPSWTEKADLPPNAPMKSSGIEAGDTIVWYDGVPIFSQPQLTSLVQDGKALVAVNRGGEVILARVPRVPVSSLKLDSFAKEELRDWTYEAKIQASKDPLLFIPYNVSSDGVVEGRIKFIDPEDEKKNFQEWVGSVADRDLEPGDKILSVDGQKITDASQILKGLQTHVSHMIVYRDPTAVTNASLGDTEKFFDKIHDERPLGSLIQALSDPALPKQNGSFVLLHGVTPRPLKEWSAEPTNDARLYLGLSGISDRLVKYNPSPIQQFTEVISEIGSTLGGLIFGHIDPKWISGPVGIVHLISDSWSSGLKNGLFWLAVISLNLACINLLPLPVLDGGTILFSFIELVSGKPFSLKLIDKLVFPFAILLIGLIIFFTYHDVLRLLGAFVS